DELLPVPGLGCGRCARRSLEGLELVFSRTSTPPSAEVSREAVRQHGQVVAELAGRSGAILPAQLGHAFRDDGELATAVREQAAQLARCLERVRGCVEFGLRATVAEAGDAEPEAETGAEYLRVRLE